MVDGLYARQMVRATDPHASASDKIIDLSLLRRLAYWLGRPSHIQSHQLTVVPLTIADFMNEWGVLDGSSPSSTQSFVSLSHLTMVLSGIMDGFYSLRPDPSIIDKTALSLSESYRAELAQWSNRHTFTPGRPQSQNPNCESNNGRCMYQANPFFQLMPLYLHTTQHKSPYSGASRLDRQT